MKTNDPIPQQREGNRSDVEQHIDASTQRQAHSNFVDACRRLLDINQWQDISGPLSASFHLTDDHGTDVNHVAKPGDFIRINIPGPGTTTGQGYDWVRIESIDDQSDPAGKQESLTIRVRPVASPLNNEDDVAHFFDDSATSTFMIERSDFRVTVSVHGRNERPNKDVDRTADKMRNTVVANVATSGLAAYQWSSLAKGILKEL